MEVVVNIRIFCLIALSVVSLPSIAMNSSALNKTDTRTIILNTLDRLETLKRQNKAHCSNANQEDINATVQFIKSGFCEGSDKQGVLRVLERLEWHIHETRRCTPKYKVSVFRKCDDVLLELSRMYELISKEVKKGKLFPVENGYMHYGIDSGDRFMVFPFEL